MRKLILSPVVPLITKAIPSRNVNISFSRCLRTTILKSTTPRHFYNFQTRTAIVHKKRFSVDSNDLCGPLSENMYETISNETLESLLEFCESLEDLEKCPKEFDATFASGVLTLNFGEHGIYVINKQAPNRQIWLSSPFSGPKRYDFENQKWIYKHDGISLHQLLQKEFSKIFEEQIILDECAYS